MSIADPCVDMAAASRSRPKQTLSTEELVLLVSQFNTLNFVLRLCSRLTERSGPFRSRRRSLLPCSRVSLPLRSVTAFCKMGQPNELDHLPYKTMLNECRW